MTNKEALGKLETLGKDRAWLSDATGYSINSLYNVFAGEERDLKERMEKAFDRAFSEEERRREVDIEKPDASVWDLVFFSGVEVKKIDAAKKAGGYKKTEDFYRDAVVKFTDDILAREKEEEAKIPRLKSVASDEASARQSKRKRA